MPHVRRNCYLVGILTYLLILVKLILTEQEAEAGREREGESEKRGEERGREREEEEGREGV